MTGLLPPGGPIWGFLDPRRGRHLWHVRCPVCGDGRMPLGDRLDGSYGLLGPCHRHHCSPLDAAEALARIVGCRELDLLADPDVGPWSLGAAMRALRCSPSAREAWRERDVRDLLARIYGVTRDVTVALGAALLLAEHVESDGLAA